MAGKKIQEDTGAKIDVRDGGCAVYGKPDTVADAVAAIKAIVDKQADFDAQRAARAAPPPDWDAANGASDGDVDPVWGGAASGDDAWGVPDDGDAWGA